MKTKRRLSIYHLTAVAVMSALAVVIQLLIPEIPIMPPSYKLGFALVPAILTSFVCGPMQGVAVVLITNIVDMIQSNSLGIGQLMNIVMGVSFIFFFMSFYRIFGGRRCKGGIRASSYFLSALVSVPLISVVGILANFALLPLFMYVMAGKPTDFTTIVSVVMTASVPFNIIKYAALTVPFYPVYYAVARSLRGVFPQAAKTA